MILVRWVIIGVLVVGLLGCAASRPETQQGQHAEAFDWRVARDCDTIGDYEAFLATHPAGENAEAALARIEELDWQEAQAIDSAAAYWYFLARHPNSAMSQDASDRLYHRWWEEISSENPRSSVWRAEPPPRGRALVDYLDELLADTYRWLERISSENPPSSIWPSKGPERERALANYEEFLTYFPEGALADSARSRVAAIQRYEDSAGRAYDLALSDGSIRQLWRFLESYPKSDLVETALTQVCVRLAEMFPEDSHSWSSTCKSIKSDLGAIVDGLAKGENQRDFVLVAFSPREARGEREPDLKPQSWTWTISLMELTGTPLVIDTLHDWMREPDGDVWVSAEGSQRLTRDIVLEPFETTTYRFGCGSWEHAYPGGLACPRFWAKNEQGTSLTARVCTRLLE